MPQDGAWSVCPHDCPSACALDIDMEAPGRIGRVRGSEVNPYTAGVICAKVARYAERVHHPDRLLRPLRRKSAKSATATLLDFEEVSWDDALDAIAEHLAQAAARHGPETVWLYSYAGTMGLLNRHGIRRLRNIMGYSRQKETICSWVIDQSTTAGIGGRFSINPLEVAESDLIIVWGTNPVYTQVNLMTLISRARKTIGERLGKSKRDAPHFYVSGEFDVEAAMQRLPAQTRINDLIQYLSVQSLLRVPELNATFEQDRLYHYDHINLGIAVALEDGLITPVLHHAERYSLQGIAAEGRALIQRTREKHLKTDDLQGGTFTISNLGVVKQVERFTAVINPPQVVILAVGTVKQRPVVINGGLHIHHTVYLTLSGDHRVVDGMHLARYMAAFQEELDKFTN